MLLLVRLWFNIMGKKSNPSLVLLSALRLRALFAQPPSHFTAPLLPGSAPTPGVACASVMALTLIKVFMLRFRERLAVFLLMELASGLSLSLFKRSGQTTLASSVNSVASEMFLTPSPSSPLNSEGLSSALQLCSKAGSAVTQQEIIIIIKRSIICKWAQEEDWWVLGWRGGAASAALELVMEQWPQETLPKQLSDSQGSSMPKCKDVVSQAA